MEQAPARVYVAVIGVGGVGTQVLSQLLALRVTYPNLHLALITSSTKSAYLPNPINNTSNLFPQLANTDAKSLLASSPQSSLTPPQVLEYLTALPSPRILIDNTSSPAIVDIYAPALKNGVHIVTPNKKAFSAPLTTWDPIRAAAFPTNPKGGLLYHESTVGAGLPIISTLKDLLATGDRIKFIEGIFSGTMSFLFNNFDPVDDDGASKKFSEVVKTARDKGFTEPDPRDDLDGGDVGRKLIILARISGLEVSGLGSFPIQSLIPNELEGKAGDMSADEFMNQLPTFDDHIEDVKKSANSKGKVIRYVGQIDVVNHSLKVGLDEFEKGSALAGLKGSDNVVSFTTERYGDRPLVVQGAGAGGAVTAMGVTSDLIKVLERVV